MNNFTKEELYIILHWAIDRLEGVGRDFFEEEGHIPLYNKIQLMIVTYCDHEYENNFGIDSRPRFEKSKNPICKKCGKYY